MDSGIGQRQTRQSAQQSRKRNNRELARRARRYLEAAMQTLGLGQLTDVPQQKRRERCDQEQGMQPQCRARAADVLPHAVHRRLVVAEVLLDLHAQGVERDDLFGGVPTQARTVNQEPRLPGACTGLARRLGGRTVSRAAIVFAPQSRAAHQHHIARPGGLLRQTTVALAPCLAARPLEPARCTREAPGILRGRTPKMHPPPKARIRDHDHLDVLPDPTVQGIEERALGLGVAELGEGINPLIDRDPPPLPGYGRGRAQFDEGTPGTHRRPIDGDDQGATLRLQSCRDGGRHPLRFRVDTGMADQPVDTFQCCFESDCPTQPPCQARETEKVSLHERRHGNPKHLAPGSMYGGELRFDKMLYDVVRVHVVGPLRWLVPEQRIYRGCTRSFCAPCLQYVEWEGISFGKGGETSAPSLPPGGGGGGGGKKRDDSIRTPHAREHNLKNIEVATPRDRFTVITGVSGSGKSTLAFDILFAEGQRRYLESLNAYARQFVQPAARPDVDAIFGIPPTVAIEH